MKRSYPQLEIRLGLFRQNAGEVIRRCGEKGIAVAAVTKGYASLPPLARIVREEGAAQLATSRLEQVEACRRAGIPGPYLLLRVPMQSELENLPALCEYSLQSDYATMAALNQVCAAQGRTHRVIVMADLGDLREGFWDREEMVAACCRVERELRHLTLAGVGVNLGCYGSIQPTVDKMEELVSIARQVEGEIGRRLEIVSGGATSSYTLVHDGAMPEGINHLRIGEAMEQPLVLKTAWGIGDLDYLSTDVFRLRAQVLEVRDKPTHPVGKIFIDAFENTPVYPDRGIRRRALVGVGKADYGAGPGPIPRLPGAEVLGGSGDHTILDVEDCASPVEVGDVVEFDLPYSSILYLTARRDLPVNYLD